MGIISRLFYFFAPYTDAHERSVGLFFKSLTEHSDASRTRKRLGELLQRDVALINLWTEYRYKGYKYLRKAERRKLYANLEIIAQDFEFFRSENSRHFDSIVAHVERLAPHANVDAERVVLIHALMDYFSPVHGRYEYRESSSFGRLLRDPGREKLVGDCNQIVTLYLYLYSRYFSVNDLKVRLLPEHVALHYGGIDIEATNGTFANYTGQEGAVLMPIEEIVSVNLLDTTDSYLATHEVNPEDFLQASRFAYILSHERSIVTHNLEAAYTMLVNSLMQRNNYTQALKFATYSRDMTLIGMVGHNGAVHAIQQHHFAAARKFAQHAPKRTELLRDSWHAEGAYLYDAHKYQAAIKAFEHVGDQSLVRRCYEALFFDEQQKLGKDMTTETIKQYASTIKRMQHYAKKSGNKSLVDHANSLSKHI